MRKSNLIVIAKNSSDVIFNITPGLLFNLVTVTSGGELILSFKDIKGKNINSFTREVNKTSKYIFKDSELILKEIIRKTTFMTPLKVDKKLSNRFLTLDIETMTVNSKMIPYCIS